MRSLLLLVAAVAAAALLATPLQGATITANALVQQQVSGLRQGIGWHRRMTWHFQALAGVARTPTDYAERHTQSVPFLRWIDQRWARRHMIAEHLARSQSAVSHWALWSCIHNGAYPGAPHEGNSSSGLYTGPLQMTYPWDGFYVHWYDVPISTVYRDAEFGFEQHGYSIYWLEHQWPQTAPPCVARGLA